MVVKKLVDRRDILNQLISEVAPQYFDGVVLDKSRLSTIGYITEAMANSMEDTITLENQRAMDYCPELSSSEIRINEAAKIRGLSAARAVPGRCVAFLAVLKYDIRTKGVAYGKNETWLTLNKRSVILYSGINFALQDDIILKAVKKRTGYVYTANYSGDNDENLSYVQTFDYRNDAGEEMLGMIVELRQMKYNVAEIHVTDIAEFTYDGLWYYYDDKLAGFNVYYKRTATDQYIKIPSAYYRSLQPSIAKCLYHNDDETGIIRILNNEYVGVGINSIIMVEMRETLGAEGNITLSDVDQATFDMYRDAAYNYSGVNVFITLLSDTTGGEDGDDILSLRKRMIDAKTRRDNIITEHDIISYVNDIGANLQLVKKQNDLQSRLQFLFTMVRDDDGNIAPTTTRRLVANGFHHDDTYIFTDQDGFFQNTNDFSLQSAINESYRISLLQTNIGADANNPPGTVIGIGDFDYYEPQKDIKVLRASNKYRLIHFEDDDTQEDYMIKVPMDYDESDGALYLTCPFSIVIDADDVLKYYFTSMNHTVPMTATVANSTYPIQMITRGIKFMRNSHDPNTYSIYHLSVDGILNTDSDEMLVDKETNEVLDPEAVRCVVVFNLNGSPTAYTILPISSYNPDTRQFTFTGDIQTTDYITDTGKLEMTTGLYTVGDGEPTTSVRSVTIDYKDIIIQVGFIYTLSEDEDPSDYTVSDSSLMSSLPSSIKESCVLINSYKNSLTDTFSLVLEFDKFSRSAVSLRRLTDGSYQYAITAVPFFEFHYGKDHIMELYQKFLTMHQVYSAMLLKTTDFEISLKFISTIGPANYLWITGGRDRDGEEVDIRLTTLTPTLYFKVYGFGAPIPEIREYIRTYLRDHYITSGTVYMSNICTLVEDNFSAVKSIKFIGIEDYDGQFQQITFVRPTLTTRAEISKYVPEQINISNINIALDETV